MKLKQRCVGLDVHKDTITRTMATGRSRRRNWWLGGERTPVFIFCYALERAIFIGSSPIRTLSLPLIPLLRVGLLFIFNFISWAFGAQKLHNVMLGNGIANQHISYCNR